MQNLTHILRKCLLSVGNGFPACPVQKYCHTKYDRDIISTLNLQATLPCTMWGCHHRCTTQTCTRCSNSHTHGVGRQRCTTRHLPLLAKRDNDFSKMMARLQSTISLQGPSYYVYKEIYILLSTPRTRCIFYTAVMETTSDQTQKPRRRYPTTCCDTSCLAST